MVIYENVHESRVIYFIDLFSLRKYVFVKNIQVFSTYRIKLELNTKYVLHAVYEMPWYIYGLSWYKTVSVFQQYKFVLEHRVRLLVDIEKSRSTNMIVAPMIPLFIIHLIKTDSGQ